MNPQFKLQPKDTDRVSKAARKNPAVDKNQRIGEFPFPHRLMSGAFPTNLPFAPHHALHLQRMMGNQAVGRIIQAKLRVGKPNDKYEQEADRMANTVMRMPEPLIARNSIRKDDSSLQVKPLADLITPLVQRQPEDKEDDSAQTKPWLQRQAEDEEEPAQAKSASGFGSPLQLKAEEDEEKTAQTKSWLQRQAEEEEKPAQAKPASGVGSPLQLKAEEDEEKAAQTKPRLQRQAEEEEPAQAKSAYGFASLLQLKAEEDEEKAAQTKPWLQRQAEEEEPAQAKFASGSDSPLQLKAEEDEEKTAQTKPWLQRQTEKEDESAQAKSASSFASPLQFKAQEDEEKTAQTKLGLQRQAEEEEEPAQAKSASGTDSPLQLKTEEDEEKTAQTKLWLQRQAEEEEETAQGKHLLQRRLADEEDEKQNRPSPREAQKEENRNGRSIESRLAASKGRGRPLPDKTRQFMESRFGSDFSQVRTHSDYEAVQMSQELNAQAFTHGRDIYFNEGKFDAGSSQGKSLLAHELTHVIQQGASPKLSQPIMPQSANQPPQQEANVEAIDVEAEIAQSEAEAKAAVDPVPAEKAKAAAKKEKPKAKKAKRAPAPEKKGTAAKPPEKAAGETAKEGEGEVPAAAEEGKPVEVSKGEVGQYLEQESAGVCDKAAEKTTELAKNEQTHDDAKQKLEQTEEAVEPPVEEGQSLSNAEQVEKLDEASAPEPSEEQAQGTLNQAIEQSVPTKMKELNEFKSKSKAKVVGSQVLGRVKKDTDAVNETYNDIETAPPAKEPEHEPTELPAEEAAPETPELELGKDAVPPLKPEHTDFSEFDQKSDDMLEKEGITDEQLNMVDEGELLEAKKEREGLKQKVNEQPAQLQEFAQQETQQVDQDMQQEEKATRTEMRDQRKQGLGQTKENQTKTKTALEKKREQVTQKINGIYESAKQNVTAKLTKLEEESLKRFDTRQEQASIEFENEVNADIDRWKRKRYSGFWGPAKWIKDKFVGIDDFPEVKQAFEKGKSNYVKKINLLITEITKDNQKVIEECKQELAEARKEIKKYVDGLAPALKATGMKAMNDMRSKLAEMDQFIDKKKEELAKKLCDKKEQAIKKIDEKIEKMKEEMSGALSKLGNFLLEAMIKFFRWALKKAGYDEKQLMGIIDKGKAVIKKIVGDPIAFIKNLIKAVKDGINNFVANIKKHLIGGLINWLTGAMGDIEIQLPEKFDLKGVLSFILQVLGLTWNVIRQKLVKRLGEKVVSFVEKGVDIVTRIVKEGPIALWNMIKEKAAEIKQQVMEGIRNWVITQLVKQAIIKLLSFLNPAGAIVQAILAIYNTIMFFVENWQRIVDFVKTVFNSIADIAMGKLSAAAAAVERAMVMTIPIILNFLSRLIGLGGIGKVVKNIIQKIRKPIDKIVDKVINFIAKKAKKLLGKVKKGLKKGKEKLAALIEWWKAKRKFKSKDGATHTLLFKGKDAAAQLMVATSPRAIKQFLTNKRQEADNFPEGKKKRQLKLIADAEKISAHIKVLQKQVDVANKGAKKKKKKKTANKALFDKLKREMESLANIMKQFESPAPEFPPVLLPPFSDNVKAPKSLMAQFVHRQKGSGFKEGTQSGAHKGNLAGWAELQKRRLTGSEWVRMHLITHRLGGDAKDSNLTPARQALNTQLKTQVEQPAREAVDKKEMIWYKVNINYHGSRNQNYISRIRVNWGYYEHSGKKWNESTKKKGPVPPSRLDESPEPPILGTSEPVDLNHDGRVFIKGLGVSRRFASLIIEERKNKKRGGLFKDENDFVDRMTYIKYGWSDHIDTIVKALTKNKAEFK